MKNLIIFVSAFIFSCEINDVRVMDMENSLPTEASPIELGTKKSALAVTQTSAGDIVFFGNDNSSGTPYLGIRKLTGEMLTIELDYQPFRIGSYNGKIAVHDGDIWVYDNDLEFEEHFSANTDTFITGFDKITFGEGTTINQINNGQEVSSSLMSNSGGTVIFNSSNHSIHTPFNTYSIGEVYNPNTSQNEFFLIKYDDQFNYNSSEEIENVETFIGNETNFYLKQRISSLVFRLLKFSASGTFVNTIEDFTIPSTYGVDYKLLKNGDLAILHVGSLYIQDIETGETLWSYDGTGMVVAFDETLDGSLLISANLSGSEGSKIFQVKPGY